MTRADSKHNWADLSAHTTMAVPARAKALVAVSNVTELAQAIAAAQQAEQPFMMLGEGSNTVFVEDYAGTVILNRMRGIKVLEESETEVTVQAAAGENWHGFVEYCVAQGWYGLENLALIPGLVGAAPMQNIGAYGVEVKDSITQVEVYDLVNHSIQKITQQACAFGYRESRFKRDWAGQKFVTAVRFRLSKVRKVELHYPALKLALDEQGIEHPSAADVFSAVVAIRSSKLPAPSEIPNSGSFFKNPTVHQDVYRSLKARFSGLVAFAQDDGSHYKLAAAWLIDHAGWKQKRIDGVGVHQDQALVIVNPERKSGEAIATFARAIQTDIQRRYGVELEIEPRLISIS